MQPILICIVNNVSHSLFKQIFFPVNLNVILLHIRHISPQQVCIISVLILTKKNKYSFIHENEL